MRKQIRNSKFEIRNPKFKTALRPGAGVSVIGALGFGFVSRTTRGNRRPPAAALSDFGLRISDFRRRAGFTLMEAALSTVIVAVMLMTALNTVGAARLTQHKAVLVSRGRMFAEALLAEILTQSYQNPTEPHTFGLETGEAGVNRAAYDDVDDYQGLSESPPVAKDGSALPNSANWSRTVTVVWVDPLDPTQVRTEESGAKRITVVAAFRNVPQATVVAVRTAN